MPFGCPIEEGNLQSYFSFHPFGTEWPKATRPARSIPFFDPTYYAKQNIGIGPQLYVGVPLYFYRVNGSSLKKFEMGNYEKDFIFIPEVKREIDNYHRYGRNKWIAAGAAALC